MHTSYGFIENNLTHVIGIDETGWGAIAGPLYVGGCIVEITDSLEWLDIRDSKRYTTQRSREIAYANLQRWQSEKKLDFFTWCISATEVSKSPADALAIAQTSVCETLMPWTHVNIDTGERLNPGTRDRAGVVVDGKKSISGLLSEVPCVAVPSADSIFKVVSAASVVAKVERDRDMQDLDNTYPTFGFHRNKGYPTAEHLKLLTQHGPCDEHRFNIAKVQAACSTAGMRNAR